MNEEKKSSNLGDDVNIRPIRTYESDVAETIEKQNESRISMSVKEDARRRQEEKQSQKTSVPAKKTFLNTTVAYISIFLVVSGLVVLGFFWWQTREKPLERRIIDTIIVADVTQKETIESQNRESIVGLIRNAGQHPRGTIVYFNFVENNLANTSVSPERFLRTLQARTPSALLRSMTGKMMLGTITLEENHPFLIVEVDSYENAFSGMLLWEKLIREDLGLIFTEQVIPADTAFKDVISKNKDLRVLETEEGDSLMAYAFLDKNTLLMTTGKSAFDELLPIFISSQQIR